MIEKKVIVKNESGFHAIPATQLTTFAKQFTDCTISVCRDNEKANAKNLLNILSLGLKKSTEITLKVDGENEEEVINKMINFIENLEG